MKFVFKWLFRLCLLLLVLAIIFFLSFDTLLRLSAQHNIRAQTGMDAEIGAFHMGLLEPVVHLENVRLHNPPDFGGTPFLNIPEIHIEYDRAALARGKIHVTLLRFNLAELDIVRNELGRTNLFAFGMAAPAKSAPTPAPAAELKRRTGLNFQQIDVLNLSLGTVKFIDLKQPQHNRQKNLGIENQVVKDVKSLADLTGLGLLIALRSGDFFSALGGLK